MAVRKQTAGKASRAKRSPREIARQADRILEEAEERAKAGKAKGLSTVTLPRAELIKKLSGRSAHSPFLTQIGWGAASRGSIFYLEFGLINPDPWPWDDNNLGLCVYWGPAGGIVEPGLSLLNADTSTGVVAVTIGTMNPSASLYYLLATHTIAATARAGRNDLNYLLYGTEAFQNGILLQRGSIGVIVT